ncbi:tetratricopeptide repeat protein [Litorimonas sp.]|uniref:tetratricopeptide repeat protein n=1 Tax=Litorimonas sp. TaxID=1892381 RepID=UPI003A878B99
MKTAKIGQTHIDFEALTIEGFKGRTSVEPKVMKLLHVLAEKPNTVFTREELITAVWGVDFGGDERLSRAISLLRKALGEQKGSRRYIETISRRGYRLIATVEDTSHKGTSDIAFPSDLTASSNPPPDFPTAFQSDQADVPSQNSSKRTPSFLRSIRSYLHKQKRMTWIGAGAAAATTVFFVMGIQASQPQNLPVNESMRQGLHNIHYFSHPGAIDGAQELFSNILAKNEQHAGASAGLALSLIREYTSEESDPALLKQAEGAARQSLEYNDQLALGHIAMGWVKEFQGDFDEALNHLNKADILDPNNALTLESRFRISGQRGDFKGAEDILNQGIALYSDDPIFPSYAADMYTYLDRLDEAETMARKSISLDPENSRSYSQLAQILHRQDHTVEAIKVLQDGLKIHQNASLYNNLGTYLFFQGQYEMSAGAFEKTLELDGNSHFPLYWANLGDAYRWVPGKEKESRQAYLRALQLWESELEVSPEDFNTQSRMALYNAKIGRIQKAKTFLEELERMEDLNSIYYYRALATAEILGNREFALSMLEKALQAGYQKTEIENDPELKDLREDANYHLTMASLE